MYGWRLVWVPFGTPSVPKTDFTGAPIFSSPAANNHDGRRRRRRPSTTAASSPPSSAAYTRRIVRTPFGCFDKVAFASAAASTGGSSRKRHEMCRQLGTCFTSGGTCGSQRRRIGNCNGIGNRHWHRHWHWHWHWQ